MRLLDVHSSTLSLTSFEGNRIPKYAILSHTWSSDPADEVLFADIGNGTYENKAAFAKVKQCLERARRDKFDWVWIDTCCVDKGSSAELSEALNSMYMWYKKSEVCYVFLEDVEAEKSMPVFPTEFQKSRWFTRGWTLQELIAPANVQFFNHTWSMVGSKAEMTDFISEITGIDSRVLAGSSPSICNVTQRMSWASKRETTRVEDAAYSLLGIFGVHMYMLYGEGENAFIRLQEQILQYTEDYSIFVWHEHPEDKRSELRSRYRGVLAYSPSNFCRLGCDKCTQPRTWNYLELEHTYHDAVLSNNPDSKCHYRGDPPMLSVRGLRLSLPAVRLNPDKSELLVYLYCTLKNRRQDLYLKLIRADLGRDRYHREELIWLSDSRPEDLKFEIEPFYLRARLHPLKSVSMNLSELLMNMTSISSETRTPGQLTDDSTFQVARRHQRRDQRDIHYWLHDSMHLVTAAAERDEAMLIELLDGFVDVNAKPNGWTALCTAIHAGHTDVARLLLKNGAHPEIKMDVEYNGIPRGATALYCAAACGHLEIVRLLVMAGANLNVHVPHSKGSRIGTNPLNAAAGRDHLGVVEYLLEAGADRFSEEWLPGWDAFTWACHEGATTVIAYFLDKKNFPVDWNDRTGLTPLQWALRGGQITVIGILSSKGAVFSAQDDKVSTPLHKAGQNDLRRSHLQGPGYPSAVTDGGPKNALDLAKEPSTEAVREITTLLESGSPDVEVMFSV